MLNLKSPKTFIELDHLFDERGIVRDCPDDVEKFLQHNNYYRFNAYFHHFLNKNDQFVAGTKLSTLLNIYENDRWLRKLFLLILEPLELQLRCQLAYWLAHYYGSETLYIPGAFPNDSYRVNVLQTFEEQICYVNAQYDPVKEHHYTYYGGHFPIWVIVEYLSFGEISKMFINVQRNVQDSVSSSFNSQPTRVVTQWMHALSTLRNACAHYGYLYRREFPVSAMIPKGSLIQDFRTKRIFSFIYAIKYLAPTENWTEYKNILLHRLMSAPDFTPIDYGFPPAWNIFIES